MKILILIEKKPLSLYVSKTKSSTLDIVLPEPLGEMKTALLDEEVSNKAVAFKSS